MNTSPLSQSESPAGHLIRHIIIEAKGSPFDILNSREIMLGLLTRTAAILKTEVMQSASHHFSPHGVTAVLIVGASHLSVHTWPEFAFATLDLVICTDSFSMDDVLGACREMLRTDDISCLEFRRGLVRSI